MKIYFVRHTQVEKEYIGKYNGHIDIALSPEGIKQAKKLALELKNIDFDMIFCSDLVRTKQTLAAMEIKTKTSPIYTALLREKFWGESEGKSFEQLQQEGKQYISFLQWIEQLGGESIEAFQKRVKNFFYNVLLTQQNKKNILVITHAGFIKMLISITQNISLEESFAFKLPYGEYVIFEDDRLLKE